MKLLDKIKNILGLDEEDFEDDSMEVEIYLDDLKPEKQDELIAAMGGTGNFDVFPIVSLLISD